MVKIDFHSHTIYSSDCHVSLSTYVQAMSERGIIPAVTDHNNMEAVWKLRKDFPTFKFIPGEEIKTTGGEIIGLFLEEAIPKGLTPKETVRRIREQGGLVYVPHPFDGLRKKSALGWKMLEVIHEVDVVEVINSRVYLPGDRKRADDLAGIKSLRKAAGSDGHSRGEYGRAFVYLPDYALEGPRVMLDALAVGLLGGGWSSIWVRGHSTAARVKKFLGMAPE
ncbi:MAG: PHP domain-containing protein [Patescibacteria group bacterium]|nr:PHP domain-containing protein [Patescibacteria group bacterium]